MGTEATDPDLFDYAERYARFMQSVKGYAAYSAPNGARSY